MKAESRTSMAERRPKAESRKAGRRSSRLRLASARQVAETFPVRVSELGFLSGFGFRLLKIKPCYPGSDWPAATQEFNGTPRQDPDSPPRQQRCQTPFRMAIVS